MSTYYLGRVQYKKENEWTSVDDKFEFSLNLYAIYYLKTIVNENRIIEFKDLDNCLNVLNEQIKTKHALIEKATIQEILVINKEYSTLDPYDIKCDLYNEIDELINTIQVIASTIAIARAILEMNNIYDDDFRITYTIE